MDTVVDIPVTLTRTLAPETREVESPDRQAADLIADTIARRDDSRLADEVVAAEKVNSQFAETLRSTDASLTTLRTRLVHLRVFIDPA